MKDELRKGSIRTATHSRQQTAHIYGRVVARVHAHARTLTAQLYIHRKIRKMSEHGHLELGACHYVISIFVFSAHNFILPAFLMLACTDSRSVAVSSCTSNIQCTVCVPFFHSLSLFLLCSFTHTHIHTHTYIPF